MRPAVVMTADALNRARRTVVVMPLSTGPAPRPPIVAATPSSRKLYGASCNSERDTGLSAESRSVAAGGEIVAHTVAQACGAGGNVAAVDRDLGTADEARLIRREKQHEIGAFLWRPLPVQRYGDARGVREGLAAGTEKAGVGDLSGMDRIDPDVPLREL